MKVMATGLPGGLWRGLAEPGVATPYGEIHVTSGPYVYNTGPTYRREFRLQISLFGDLSDDQNIRGCLRCRRNAKQRKRGDNGRAVKQPLHGEDPFDLARLAGNLTP